MSETVIKPITELVKEKAAAIFKKDKKLSKLWYTSDGLIFYRKEAAEFYATRKKLTVRELTRNQVLKAKTETEKGDKK